MPVLLTTCSCLWGWSDGAKVSCILCHWDVQLILAYNWARPAILVVGKGRGGMFLLLLFLHFHSCSSFFPVPLFHLLSLFSLLLGDDTKWPTRVDVSLNPQHNCSCLKTTGWVANSIDPDQMPHSVVTDLSLHCLLRHVPILRINAVIHVPWLCYISRYLSLIWIYSLLRPISAYLWLLH